VRNDSNLMIYANGELEKIGDSNGSPMATPGLLYLGISADRAPNHPDGFHDGFTGNMEDFMIFDYALSRDEVAHIASDGSGTFYMDSAVNIYDKELSGSAINFRDYAEIFTAWLEEMLWP